MQETLEEMLVRHEGLQLAKYRCPAGYWTIGTGHNIDAKGLPAEIQDYLNRHGVITHEMAIDLLIQDIGDAQDSCRRLYRDFGAFSFTRRNALVDLIFNMGEWKIRRGFPEFVKAVNRQDWQRAANELKYVDGLKKDKHSDYWLQLHGDPDGTDDHKVERPEEIYRMLKEG